MVSDMSDAGHFKWEIGWHCVSGLDWAFSNEKY